MKENKLEDILSYRSLILAEKVVVAEIERLRDIVPKRITFWKRYDTALNEYQKTLHEIRKAIDYYVSKANKK